MLSEDFVTYNIMKFLQNSGWKVLQYHPPGGQAYFPLVIEKEIIYNDIIAYKQDAILLLENKNKFSLSDINKLQKIISDPACHTQLSNFVSEYLRQQNLYIPLDPLYKFMWGHGFSGKFVSNQYNNIYLFYVDENGITKIYPPKC